MAYEYRKMSPEQQAEVLRRRQEAGYPLHAPPHPFRESGRYLITAANFEHAPIITPPDRCTDFETSLLEIMQAIAAEVYAWVVFPITTTFCLASRRWTWYQPR